MTRRRKKISDYQADLVTNDQISCPTTSQALKSRSRRKTENITIDEWIWKITNPLCSNLFGCYPLAGPFPLSGDSVQLVSVSPDKGRCLEDRGVCYFFIYYILSFLSLDLGRWVCMLWVTSVLSYLSHISSPPLSANLLVKDDIWFDVFSLSKFQVEL